MAIAVILSGLLNLTAVPAVAWDRLPEHPRLFASAARWGEIARLSETDAFARQLAEVVRARADWLLNAPPVSYTFRDRGQLAGSLLTAARSVQERVLALALTARLTGEARYRQRALVELRALAALPDWNPAVFLDTAEATVAAAIGYDWLFADLTPAERDLLVTAIIEKGLRPSFEGRPEWLRWVRGTNNWNQVCHAGLVLGALAVAEVEPELARRTVDRALAELHSSAAAYAPDGVYPEGPTYWSYGTTFHVGLLAALETALGDRYGLDEFPGFLQTADYLTQVTGPSGQTFNYADSTASRGFEPALIWFARRLGRPELAAREVDWPTRTTLRPDRELPRFCPLALLWWQPAGPAAGPSPSLAWLGAGPVPVAVLRSAWNDPRAVWVALKGGRAGVSHGHMDGGSFVLEADGVRWAVDPGMQSYDTLYAAGIDSGLWNFRQDSPRWSVFRLGPEGHNILRFNGGSPRVDGTVTLTDFDPAARRVTADLTPAWRETVTQARRTVHLQPDRRVTLTDEWQAAQPVEVTAQWLTMAEVTLAGPSAILRQRGQTLRLTVLEPPGAELTVEDTVSLLRPHDAPNPGLKRLLLVTRAAAGGAGRSVLEATPGG